MDKKETQVTEFLSSRKDGISMTSLNSIFIELHQGKDDFLLPYLLVLILFVPMLHMFTICTTEMSFAPLKRALLLLVTYAAEAWSMLATNS